MPGVSNIIDICKDEYRKGYKDGYKDSDSRIPDLIRDIHDCVAEEMHQKGGADAIDEALAYCNQNNDEKEECWSCCLSIWKDGQFGGCYLEKLKEQKK